LLLSARKENYEFHPDGIKVFWMQLGIYNEQVERKAKENGINVVYI
jgi:predicted CoA-binding protein